jgi:hypothetical protein
LLIGGILCFEQFAKFLFAAEKQIGADLAASAFGLSGERPINDP